jgi:hypothetical protein
MSKTAMPRVEIGCHGDGSLGHRHTRTRAAMLLEALAWDEDQRGNTERGRLMRETARDLRAATTDDGSEETQACLWLDDAAYHPGAAWGWRDGDFGLWPMEDDDE